MKKIIFLAAVLAIFSIATFAQQVKCSGDPCNLPINVYIKKDITAILEPPSNTGLAGTKLTYRLAITNPNPVSYNLRVTGTAPAGWNISFPSVVAMSASGSRQINIDVTSYKNATVGTYTFTIALTNTTEAISKSIIGIYKIGERGAPGMTIEPAMQVGNPGDTRTYTITLANNDPADFDASTIFLRHMAPSGWSASFSRPSVRIRPNETAEVNFTLTSPMNISEPFLASIGINATANSLSGFGYALYNVSLCGDEICQLNEICDLDCRPEPHFSCDEKRCEETIDDGVRFSANVDFLTAKFLVCKFKSTATQCEADFDKKTTGLKRSGICGSVLSDDCAIRCVDDQGAYFIYSKGVGSANMTVSNYSFSCPYVNLPGLVSLKNDFSKALDSYEQEQSVLVELVKTANDTTRSRMLPCIDALSGVIKDVQTHVKYMGEVISSPALSNATAARSRTAELRISIDTRLNQYCRGAGSGFLKIDVLTPPPRTEVNSNAQATVKTTNVGSITYYGYVECQYSIGSSNTTFKDECSPYAPGQERTFTPSMQVQTTGTWTLQCKTIGSLKSDCSTSIHDVETANFDVYSKETNVVDVAGSCDIVGVRCTVRSSQPSACSGCRIEYKGTTTECQFKAQNGSVSTFDCPKNGIGFYNLTGYIKATNTCVPIEPKEKNIAAICQGCGDGIVDRPNETCELPGTDNNPNVKQAAGVKCQDTTKKSFVTDSFGYCTSSCQGIQDVAIYTCKVGVCGAQCNEGDVKDVLVQNGTKSCYATVQCSSKCEFTAPNCEPVEQGEDSIDPLVEVVHSPLLPRTGQDITFTAAATDASGITLLEIIVNGNVVKSCTTGQCTFTAKYPAGTYTYTARAKDGFGNVGQDLSTGPRMFTVTGTLTNTTNDTTGPLVSSTHSPLLPTTGDNVTITAMAIDAIGISSIDIFVDNVQRATCQASTCTYKSVLPAGAHSYIAIAHDSKGNPGREMPSGSNVFTVRSGQDDTNTVSDGNTTLSLSLSPGSPKTTSVVTIAANSNTQGRITIFVDDVQKKNCNSSPCAYVSIYPQGGHSFYAVLSYGNSTLRNPQNGARAFFVSLVNQTSCGVKVTSKNCRFDPDINKYVVDAGAAWSGIGTGDHAHLIIDNDEYKKFFVNSLSRSAEVSGNGAKNVIAVVHNANDTSLCVDQQTVLCGGTGNVSGDNEISIARDVAATVKTGKVPMELTILASKDVSVEFTEHVPTRTTVKNITISSNATPVQGTLIDGGVDYATYTWKLDMKANDKITISYDVTLIDGEYRFFSIGRIGAKEIGESKKILATSCPQTDKVMAKQGDICKGFATACDVPPGWNQVSSCSQQSSSGGTDLITISIAIIALGAAGAVAFLKKEKIQEFLSREEKIIKKLRKATGG